MLRSSLIRANPAIKNVLKLQRMMIQRPRGREFTALASLNASDSSFLPHYLRNPPPFHINQRSATQIERTSYAKRNTLECNRSKIMRYGFDMQLNEDDLVGEGNFAKVYKSFDLKERKMVAVKVMKKKVCPKEVYAQEVKVMSMLNDLKLKITSSGEGFEGLGLHRDVFETQDSVCLVFDLQRGGELFDEIINDGVFKESEARSLMQALIPSIDTMHNNNFIHRDIKLENLLLANDSTSSTTTRASSREDKLRSVRLTDFGYSKRLGEVDNFRTPAGTYGYVAPEILSSRQYGTACDIWSLGVVLYSSIAGYHPFPHKPNTNCVDEVGLELEAIRYGTRKICWDRDMNKPAFSSASPELKDLLKKMLDPNPTTRITAYEISKHSWYTQQQPEQLLSEA